MKRVDQVFAQEFLSRPDVYSFWDELQHPIDLPETFRFLFDSGCLFIIEPVESFVGIHVATTTAARGKIALDAGKAALRECLSLAERVVARVLKTQPQTQRYAAMCGMSRYSENETHIFYEVRKCH